MKMALVLSLIMLGQAVPALADNDNGIHQVKGKARTYSLPSSLQAVIVITGDAAEKIFNDLDAATIVSAPGETDGPRNIPFVQKAGENYTCTKFIRSSRSSEVKCEMQIMNRTTGVVGQGGVG